MTKPELEQIVKEIKVDKRSYSITKRTLINAFGYAKRTSGNVKRVDKFLEENEIGSFPNYKEGYIGGATNLIYKPNNIPLSDFRLYSLYIEEYKNLRQVTINFESTTNYCAFIGLNGSGKSNILEAISAIFRSLYQENSCHFPYTMCYAVEGKYYPITNGKLLSNNRLALPKNIIASYSGEDTRLWDNHYKHIYDRYCNNLTAQQGFSPPFLFYISRHQWEIAMLTLLCSDDIDVKQFVAALIGNCNCTIEFKFVNSNAAKWTGTTTEAFVEELKKKTTYSIDEFRDVIGNISFIDRASTLFYCLYMSSTGKENRLISKIHITFDDGTSLDSFSEGEKRMILTNTIIHILATENSLCLFDEPDSHIHISKKAELLKLIDNDKRYSILTTHSPIFLKKLKDDNIFIIDRGRLHELDLVKNISELSDGEINYIAGTFILSSKNIVVVEGTSDIKYINKAIEVFSNADAKYKQLEKIAFIPQGSASHTESFFKDVIEKIIPECDELKLLYVFDYDQEGIKGWRKIHEYTQTYTNLEKIFYQDNYSDLYDPTSRNLSYPFFLEDLFDSSCYSDIVSALHRKSTYKEFKTTTEATHNKIKTKIEKEYTNFGEDVFQGFQPLLDKMLSIFFPTS